MKRILICSFFTFGLFLAVQAQSTSTKSVSDSPSSVSTVKVQTSVQPTGVTTSKGVTEHGPNDINPRRTDSRPTAAPEGRSKSSVVSSDTPDYSEVDNKPE